jgi:hypothetical protein
VVGFLADNEKSNYVISVDVIEVRHVGGNVLEDKQDAVSLIQVNLLVFFNGV